MLVTVSTTLGVLAVTLLRRAFDWTLLPILAASIAAILPAVLRPDFYSLPLALLALLAWSYLYRHWWWLVKIGWRKESGEVVVKLSICLYNKFGYQGYAEPARPLQAPSKPSAGEVVVVRTARGTGERLSPVPPLVLVPDERPKKGEVCVLLDSSVRYQTCLGFGGAFTESSAELLLKMGPKSQEQIIDGYFRSDTGIGYQMGRLHMNSCDFSNGNWSCCDKEGDTDLESFTINRYEKAILPMVRRAVAAAGRPLLLLASPWSPPAWMKDTGTMCKGGRLKPECREAWARHYVRFAEALKAAELPLWGFTVQNEPDGETPWENCLYSPEEERDFVRDYLGPALQKSSLELKLIAWDHNRDELVLRAQTMYGDPDAAKYIWGMGFHWYGDPRHEWWADSTSQACFENVRRVHELRPDRHLMVTETCQEGGPHIGDWHVGERYAESVIRDFNNWAEAWMDWNLILDTNGGYNHVGNHCSAPVLADSARDLVLFQPSFFFLGHFSRYILPGAQRVLCASNREALEVTAFANPDQTVALILLNRSDDQKDFCLSYGGALARAVALPHSITTYLLRESADAGPH